MKKVLKNSNGITLVALVVTIAILLILVSVTVYNGARVIKSSKLSAFSTEMKVMQMQVNQLYENYKNGNAEVLNLGEELSLSSQENTAFANANITDKSGYRYFSKDTIKSLNIEDIEGEFLVNVAKRSVISYEGFDYEGKTYYTVDQLPNGLYNVEYNEE